ncbi:MAG: GGDEF domain-containing protein [Lachnospiraceae bacterium]|nr:GGDEF domain-containing protein [Lachnospiraceae bacterium]
MKKRKCIGVFLGQPNLSYQTKVLECIANESFLSDCDVAVYSSIVANGAYDNCRLSAVKVMDLVNFEKLDAVIVLPDTLNMSKEHSEQVISIIKKKFHGPCVSLDIEVPGWKNFVCDDISVVHDLLSHIILKHNCKDIAYITGPKTHPHSLLRLEGFYQTMKEYGLDADPTRVFFGDFWYNAGEGIVEEIVTSERGLPDAVCCANGTMAIAVYEALMKRGIRIPEDVIVTGFDAYANGVDREKHPITSTLRKEGEMVHEAMNFIRSKLGLPMLPKEEHKTCLLFDKSCGCEKNTEAYPEKRIIEKGDFFFSFYNFMNEDLISAQNIKECIWKIDWYTENIVNFDRMMICLCDDWNSLYKDPTDEFSDRMLLAFDKRPNDRAFVNDFRNDSKRTFDRKQMVPNFGQEEHPAIYYFNTLYFADNCFGYIVLNYSSKGTTYVYDDIYPYWIRYVNNSLESLKRLYAVNVLYKNAEQKAITDVMTGLYNRNGYNVMIQEMMNSVQDNESFLILLFDNNGLKQVNDTYGHVAGDEVIRISAEIVSRRYFPGAREEKNFRIGGDEYVKLVVGEVTEDDASLCIRKIQELLKIKAAEKGFPVQLAGGYELCTKNNMPTTDMLLSKVDKQMYTNKQFLKENQ